MRRFVRSPAGMRQAKSTSSNVFPDFLWSVGVIVQRSSEGRTTEQDLEGSLTTLAT